MEDRGKLPVSDKKKVYHGTQGENDSQQGRLQTSG